MKDVLFKTLMLKGDRGGTIVSIDKIAETGVTDTMRITLDDGTYIDFDVNNTVDEHKVAVIIDEKTPAIVGQANTYTDNQISSLINRIYPVGSIFMSTVNVNPSTYLGGSWEAWGSGRVPVGVNAQDSDFNTPEKSGGNKTTSYTPSGSVDNHTLTIDEIPAHNHGGKIGVEGNPKASLQLIGGYDAPTGGDYSLIGVDYTGEAGSRMDPATSGSSDPHNHGFTGSSANISTLQPFITCYMFKRYA